MAWVKILRLVSDQKLRMVSWRAPEPGIVHKSQPCVPNMVHDVGDWEDRNANADDDPVSEESLLRYCNELQVYLTSSQASQLR